MKEAGRSEVLGVAAIGALAVCCGGPLLVAALVALGASAGLILQGAVLVGVAGLGVAAVLGVRYTLRRSGTREAGSCAECAADRSDRHRHQRHAAPPPA